MPNIILVWYTFINKMKIYLYDSQGHCEGRSCSCCTLLICCDWLRPTTCVHMDMLTTHRSMVPAHRPASLSYRNRWLRVWMTSPCGRGATDYRSTPVRQRCSGVRQVAGSIRFPTIQSGSVMIGFFPPTPFGIWGSTSTLIPPWEYMCRRRSRTASLLYARYGVYEGVSQDRCWCHWSSLWCCRASTTATLG